MYTKSPFSALFLLGSGLMAGYLTALYLSPKQRLKQKMVISKLSNQLPEIDFEMLAQKVFGSSTEDLKAKIQDLIYQFQSKIDSLQIAFNMIDQKKYEDLIENFGKSLEKTDASFTKRQISQLKKYLLTDYRIINSSLKS